MIATFKIKVTPNHLFQMPTNRNFMSTVKDGFKKIRLKYKLII